MDDQPKIRVVVRKRPLTRKEQTLRQQDIVQVKEGTTVVVREMKEKVDLTKFMDQHHFVFDNAFDQAADNSKIYETCVRPIVQSAFHGARVTCFAYGQTGSGKTYTMNGDPQRNVAGMYILAAHDIFAMRQDPRYRNLHIVMSFYEIYCGKLYDLLNGRTTLSIREDAKQNVNVIGLTERKIHSAQDFMQIIAVGGAARVTSQNSTNADSSRSHAILQISLMEGKKIHGKISFIDLAGCERGADTMEQNKQTRIDGAEINKSLLALKQCIRALDNGKSHTPFRGSKLTMVLKDSLTGFCRTLMIGNISPNESSCENTLNTLRYADRVKELRKGGGQPISRDDALARELMLPRMNKNKQTTFMSEDEESEDSRLFQDAPPRTNYQVSQMEQQRQQTYRGSVQLRVSKPAIIEEQAENLNTNRLMNRVSLDGGKSNVVQGSKGERRHSLAPNIYQKTQPPLIQHPQNNSVQPNPSTEPLSSSQSEYWQQLLDEFRTWHPRSYNEVLHMSQKFKEMSGFLQREQLEVLAAHKSELEYGYETFQNSLNLFNSTTANTTKSYQQLKQYPAMIGPYVQRKMELVCNFKSKLDSFNEHMKEHEACMRKLEQAQQHISRQEDEVSLLDEVRQEEELFLSSQQAQLPPQPQPYYFNYQQQQPSQFGQHSSNYNTPNYYSGQPQQPSSRYSQPVQQNYFEPQRQPTHNHNTRYSVNMTRPYCQFDAFAPPASRY